jgi:hypothetical protein
MVKCLDTEYLLKIEHDHSRIEKVLKTDIVNSKWNS